MDWVKQNIVGLLSLLVVVGGSYITLYIKVAVNTEAIEQVESKLDDFTATNNRLIESLDKLEILYNASNVKDAVQDTKLAQAQNDIAKLEENQNEN